MRGRKGAVAVLFALVILIMAAVPTSSVGLPRIQTTIDPGGRSGHMWVSTQPSDVVSWEACSSEITECRPWHGGPQSSTVGAPAGTVFRVKYNEIGAGLSPEWRGPLKEMAPPHVDGLIQANEYVTPVRGLWSGGWAGEPAELQLSACETEDGEGCVSLTAPSYIRRCPFSSSFSLEPQFVSWYLRVADRQNGGPYAEAGGGRITPFGDPIYGRNQTTSVAMVGQIAPAVNPPRGECGPAPAPTATISAEGTARVECGGGCHAELIGTRKGRRVSIAGAIREQNLLRPEEVLELRLPSKSLARLGAGRVRLIAEVYGVPLARRTIRSAGS